MKKIICILLSVIMAMLCMPLSVQAAQPVFSADFENGNEGGISFCGSAKIECDSESRTNSSLALHLDGNDSYIELTGQTVEDNFTVSFDVKPEMNSGIFFTFAMGADSTKYTFLRIRGNEIRNAITTSSWQDEREVKGVLPYNNEWMNVAIVFCGTNMKLYVNGKLIDENNNTGITLTNLNSSLKVLFGKSFYDGDGYYKGWFDNIKLYNSALSDQEIKDDMTLELPILLNATVGGVEASSEGLTGSDNHTAVYTKIDHSLCTVDSYVKASQDLKKVPLSFIFGNEGTEVYLDDVKLSAPYTVDLTTPKTLEFRSKGNSSFYKFSTPKIANNPVLPGQYADPDISILDGRFWIFPTTDGFGGWSGTEFHAFSSDDLVNWNDEGVILDNKDKSEKTNDKGIKIATSKWSDGNAWAPAATEKNGKYYFYYCGRVADDYISAYGNGMAIGVAVANSPSGPYTACDSPILYPKMLTERNIGFEGQVIDPSVFTDTDGQSYILFGNGNAAIATLNSNMTEVNTQSLRIIKGLDGFRESVAVFKRNNVYYFTWSCDDTGSENYHVKYGYTSHLENDVVNKGTILEKDESKGILGTGHQSVLYIPETDKCFIAYHRFYTPLGFFSDGLGFHRETCIDEITFNKKLLTDEINKVTPSFEGAGKYNVKGEKIEDPQNDNPPDSSDLSEQNNPTPAPSTASTKITVGKVKLTSVKAGKKLLKTKWNGIGGVTGYQVQYSTSKKFTKKTTKTKHTNKNALSIKKLKAKKKYFVRVRAYKNVWQNGKKVTYYGAWSNVKNAKTK